MSAVNVKTVSFTITSVEEELFNEVKRLYYDKNRSEVFRMILKYGAKELLRKENKRSKRK